MDEYIQHFLEEYKQTTGRSTFRFNWSMKNANFLYDEQMYEARFDRKARQWTPEQLMGLYFAAKERSDKRQKAITAVINTALEELTPDENGKIKLYNYTDDEDGSIRVHTLRKDRDFGWGWSQDWLKFSNDKEKRRDEKIKFLLENERAFELGEKLVAKDAMRSWHHRHVWKAICDLIDRRLCEHFKKTKFGDMPHFFTIDFGGHAMYVEMDKNSNSSWKKFNVRGLADDERIKIWR